MSWGIKINKYIWPDQTRALLPSVYDILILFHMKVLGKSFRPHSSPILSTACIDNNDAPPIRTCQDILSCDINILFSRLSLVAAIFSAMRRCGDAALGLGNKNASAGTFVQKLSFIKIKNDKGAILGRVHALWRPADKRQRHSTRLDATSPKRLGPQTHSRIGIRIRIQVGVTHKFHKYKPHYSCWLPFLRLQLSATPPSPQAHTPHCALSPLSRAGKSFVWVV